MTIEPEAVDGGSREKKSRWLVCPSVSMVVALALLAASAWLWLGVGKRSSPPVVGSRFPPTRLERFNDADPFLVLGLEGRITWLVFLPVNAPEGLEPLDQLEPFQRELRSNRRFSMIAATIDRTGPDHPSSALQEYRGRLPLYVAGGEVQRLFGVERAGSPRHILIGPRGRIDLIVDGADRETIDRVAQRARLWLDVLAPPRDARFFLARVD